MTRRRWPASNFTRCFPGRESVLKAVLIGPLGAGLLHAVQHVCDLLAQHRAHQHRLGNPALLRVELGQHADPRVDVARCAGKGRGNNSALEVFFQELRCQAVNVAADEEVARAHRSAVGGIGEDHGCRFAAVRHEKRGGPALPGPSAPRDCGQAAPRSSRRRPSRIRGGSRPREKNRCRRRSAPGPCGPGPRSRRRPTAFPATSCTQRYWDGPSPPSETIGRCAYGSPPGKVPTAASRRPRESPCACSRRSRHRSR